MLRFETGAARARDADVDRIDDEDDDAYDGCSNCDGPPAVPRPLAMTPPPLLLLDVGRKRLASTAADSAADVDAADVDDAADGKLESGGGGGRSPSNRNDDAEGSATLPPADVAVIMPPAWPRLDEPNEAAEDEGYEEDGMEDERRAPPSEYSAAIAASPPLRSPCDGP
jgi:hypothetical protein